MTTLFTIGIALFTMWLTVSVIYITIYSVAGLFYKYKSSVFPHYFPKIAIFIPAYKEDAVIVKAAKEALKHQYLGTFKVIVIADHLQETTINELKELDLLFFEVDFEVSTKAKALNYALENMKESFDIAMILDADNIMTDKVLHQVAFEYCKGEKAIQLHRCAASKTSNFAVLDAISEEVNNHIYSKGPAVLGLSSRLVGSGMAFDYRLFKRLMSSIKAIGGFDKELELLIINEKIKIKYIHGARVFDEKVNSGVVFAKQRSRWISAQYHFLLKKIIPSFLNLFSGNIDYFLKTMQLALPPRLLLPGILLLGSVVFQLVGLNLFAAIWTVLTILIAVAYGIAIPKDLWNKQLMAAALSLPKAFLLTFKAILSIGTANKTFIHTPHTGAEFNGINAQKN